MVIIAGGRDFSDYGRLREKVEFFLSLKEDIKVVCGEATQ